MLQQQMAITGYLLQHRGSHNSDPAPQLMRSRETSTKGYGSMHVIDATAAEDTKSGGSKDNAKT
jgi:hypothetical protein